MSPMRLGRKAGREAAEQLSERDQRLVWRIAALLLDYPNQQTLDMLPALGPAADSLPAPAGPALRSFVDHAAAAPDLDLAAHYVETFDLRKRACLHLTYYAYGDTRKRGMALLRLKHAYKAADVELDEHELPDHLSVVLEFAATADPTTGRRLLVEHRPVIELVRLSLVDIGSPYHQVLDAVCSTLPELNTADRRRIAELAAQGPPDEEVGLEPFAMDPSLMEPDLGGRR
ncbi:respiratory nitrate reductase chaperone NarJ [Actinokineospora alba]|uniref:Respiratory nitrate reductase chaperone NarJ n=1 Tax=Actinokineospora alba TaxID=504798 RepID=A0A1H0LJ82_9PSEU|nr:nitrate reductase molybdenum cofactor assembly chaperone [Actinokineospora alba]TDP67344.1 respiratory nitrate reductase chaperone NarJ [Actinokineospora alba]SDI99624.1 nitrate reductase delta subunit [Actinokineospora alba]SDO68133.1 respiratory nitrate reductase chaperone NarJ [Actinokineospora alba]